MIVEITPFTPIPFAETLTQVGSAFSHTGTSFVVVDRDLYYGDDNVAHAAAVFRGVPTQPTTWSYRVFLVDPSASTRQLVYQGGPSAAHTPQIELALEMSSVPHKSWQLEVELLDTAGRRLQTAVSATFERVLAPRPATPQAAGRIEIRVDRTPLQGLWPITTGVPFPQGVLDDSKELILVDDLNRVVESQMKVLSWWHPPLGKLRSVRWLSLDFTAEVGPHATRRYFLHQAPRPAVNTAWVNMALPDVIVVDTGAIRFEVRKTAFDGIHKLERWDDGQWTTVVQGGLGPYLCVEALDESNHLRPGVFAARLDPNVQVDVEELGSTRVTIVARGEYIYTDTWGTQWKTDQGQEAIPKGLALCRFVTRITAFRGLAQLHISHRTILTYDCGTTREDLWAALSPSERTPYLEDGDYRYQHNPGEWWKRPIDIGWEHGLTQLDDALFGYEDHTTGRVLQMNPWDGCRVSMHQHAHDECAVVVDTLDLRTGSLKVDIRRPLAARRSEGWVTAQAPGCAVTLALRDMWQRYPKELSVHREADSTARMSVHFWPRHGLDQRSFGADGAIVLHNPGSPDAVPFEADQSLLRHNIYKLRYAHSGRALDTRMPTDVARQLIRLDQGVNTLALENPFPLAIQQTLTRTAEGLAVGGDFALFVQTLPTGAPSDFVADQSRRLADLFSRDPHALALPHWNAASRTEGAIAPADHALEPFLEGAMLAAVKGYRRGIVDAAGEYGMWIYGDIHDNWLPGQPSLSGGADTAVGVPALHRVWSASHYRSVWTAWLLYLRSGDPELRHWARATSDHFLDVNTAHADTGWGRRRGDMLHCYGTTPWGSEGECAGHFIDPDAYRLRLCLTSDGWASDAYRDWWKAFSVRGGAVGGGREAVNNFGAVLGYYLHTRDASALVLVRAMAKALFDAYRVPGATSAPWFEFTNYNAGHAVWHRQWLALYHELTGDPDAVRFVIDWHAYSLDDVAPGPSAFAYFGTRSSLPPAVRVERFVAPRLRDLWDLAATVLRDSQSRYDGYGAHVAAVSALWLQEAPYLLAAVHDAGLRIEWAPAPSHPPPSPTVTPRALELAYPYRRRRGLVTYSLVPAGTAEFAVRLRIKPGINETQKALTVDVRRFVAGTASWATFVGSNVQVTVNKVTDVVVLLPATGVEELYELTVSTTNADDTAVPLIAPLTDFPEVAELWGAPFSAAPEDRGRIVSHHQSTTFGRQAWFMAPNPASGATVTLVLEAYGGVSGNLPSFVRVATTADKPIEPRRVSPPPRPWGPFDCEEIRKGPAATMQQPLPRLGSGYQLFSFSGARDQASLGDRIQAGYVIAMSSLAPAQLYCAATYGPTIRVESGADRIFVSLGRQGLQDVLRFVDHNTVPLEPVPPG
jgi:hypothetical protein